MASYLRVPWQLIPTIVAALSIKCRDALNLMAGDLQLRGMGIAKGGMGIAKSGMIGMRTFIPQLA